MACRVARRATVTQSLPICTLLTPLLAQFAGRGELRETERTVDRGPAEVVRQVDIGIARHRERPDVVKERGPAPAPKIPQPERSSRVRFLAGLDGDGEAEGFELPDGAPALLFLTGLAHDASTGVGHRACRWTAGARR